MRRKWEMGGLLDRFLEKRACFIWNERLGFWGNDMRITLLICSLLCAAAWVTSALEQRQVAANHPLAEIRYRPVGKLIYVPVQVNGSSAEWFIFDTGAPNSLIDTALAKSLHLSAISSGIIHGAGKGDVSANDAGDVELTLGRLRTRVPHAKIVDLSKVPVPAKGYGLIGAEFLEQYVVRIDPLAHTIDFYDPKAFVYRGKGQSLPLELTNSRLYIQAGLAAKPGQPVQRRLRVDTGSEDSIDDDTIRSSSVTQKTTLGNGLGNSYEDVSGVYDTVVIGPFKFRHVWGPAGAVAIIGMEMMRRFTLTIDAMHGRLYLDPNSSYSEPVPAPS
jgi:Aspartyl protease